jgi:DNA-binding transcriptional MocR family regulator
MVAALREHMPEWVEYDVPSGGYFVWLRLPAGTDGAALRAIAKQHGVDVRHGAQFSPTGALGNHLRLSYAYYDDAEIVEGVARLGRALRKS